MVHADCPNPQSDSDQLAGGVGAGDNARNRKLSFLATSSLTPDPCNPRRHTTPQIRSIAKSIDVFGFNAPILVRTNGQIVSGHGRHEAAKMLGLEEVPVIFLDHLSEVQAKAYMLADNKLTDRSAWDDTLVATQLKELSNLALDFSIEATGFELPEIDLRIQSLDLSDQDALDNFDLPSDQPATVRGDIWTLGDHQILCGTALDSSSYLSLLRGEKASAVFTDPPYNVKIDGHVRGKGRGRHREFEMASGELSNQAFENFLSGFLQHCSEQTVPGAVIYAFMDWRHGAEMLAAGARNKLTQVNLCVWVKTNGGMGSFYRSRHELVFVFRNGGSQHINNIQLGRFGRNRTNVWQYAGANGFTGRKMIDEFESHPTVKPVGLISDALLDCTNRGDIVLDPFLGSGTTVLAAERTGRRCYGIELDPLHVDTAVQRWEKMTRRKAVNLQGQTFAEVRSSKGISG